jgi:hypothetical protein
MDAIDGDHPPIGDSENASSLDILEWAGRSPRLGTRRNSVTAWIAVVRNTRSGSFREYALAELVTAALHELKPGEIDRDFLEFAAKQIGELEPELRRSAAAIVLNRIADSTIEARRAAIVGQH